MAVNLENYIPALQYNGLNSAKSGTLSGNITFSGTNTFSGTTSFTGAVTQKAAVISGQGATATLTAAQSGSVCLFDRPAGIVYTLPAPAVGLTFSFVATASVTSNSYKVITDAGTTFLIGSVNSIDTDSTNALAAYTGNGSTHIALTQAAASSNATGGLQGSIVTFTCVSSTLWEVSGTIQAAGSPATPFATS